MLGILTPYGRNEVTAAAIRVADLAVACGREVRLIACGVLERNVHPFWDTHVANGRREGTYRGAHGCSAYIHFVCDPHLLSKTRLVGEKALHVLVPDWTATTEKVLSDTAPAFDTVVCPTKACYNRLIRGPFRGQPAGQKRITWTNWDAGINAVPREGTVTDKRLRACFHCDHNAIDFCGPVVLQLIDDLLGIHDHLDITVVSTKSWAKEDRRQMSRLTRKWEERFHHVTAKSLADQMTEYHTHDWVVLPSVRGSFGMTVMRAMVCGCPTVVHDVDPYCELISNDRNGCIVPCDIRYGATLAPVAVPDIGRWMQVLNRAFADTSLLFSMQCRPWPAQIKSRRDAFDIVWRRLLGF